MRALMLALTLFAPAFAQADIIVCHFTEPFRTTTYSMAQQKLTLEDSKGNTSRVRNASFQIHAQGRFEILDRNRNLLQSLELNFTGSDGMSDRVYPYTAEYDGQIGGCESNYLKAVDQAP